MLKSILTVFFYRKGINAALNEEGYLPFGEKEVYSIYEPYKEKKDKKYFMSMVNPHV